MAKFIFVFIKPCPSQILHFQHNHSFYLGVYAFFLHKTRTLKHGLLNDGGNNIGLGEHDAKTSRNARYLFFHAHSCFTVNDSYVRVFPKNQKFLLNLSSKPCSTSEITFFCMMSPKPLMPHKTFRSGPSGMKRIQFILLRLLCNIASLL